MEALKGNKETFIRELRTLLTKYDARIQSLDDLGFPSYNGIVEISINISDENKKQSCISQHSLDGNTPIKSIWED